MQLQLTEALRELRSVVHFAHDMSIPLMQLHADAFHTVTRKDVDTPKPPHNTDHADTLYALANSLLQEFQHGMYTIPSPADITEFGDDHRDEIPLTIRHNMLGLLSGMFVYSYNTRTMHVATSTSSIGMPVDDVEYIDIHDGLFQVERQAHLNQSTLYAPLLYSGGFIVSFAAIMLTTWLIQHEQLKIVQHALISMWKEAATIRDLSFDERRYLVRLHVVRSFQQVLQNRDTSLTDAPWEWEAPLLMDNFLETVIRVDNLRGACAMLEATRSVREDIVSRRRPGPLWLFWQHEKREHYECNRKRT